MTFARRLASSWHLRAATFVTAISLAAAQPPSSPDTAAVPRFAPHEVAFTATGTYANPYVELTADATLTAPDGHTTRNLPLFWDGDATWRFRFAPDQPGTWHWSVKSTDRGLNGRSGKFDCVASTRRGSLQPLAGAPLHFQYQNGERVWFLGDTAWSFAVDTPEEGHDRAAAERYAANRASQGFNAIHLMLLSEVGWGNRGGLPWIDLATERINPAYFREVDERIAFANARGLITGLAVAWGYKGRKEPYAWSRLPNLAAQERYARTIAARYGAFDVYFIVSGEWDAEIRHRPAPEADVRREFVHLGDVLRAADPHRRMIAIHPTQNSAGSTREFNTGSTWMDFGDYQQNYNGLHASILTSRAFNKPVVNAEYAYWLRDSNGDGVVDKAHSYTLDDIRAATWDIAMAGGYVVTGFGSTYLGGARHLTKFLPDDPKNGPWLEQIAHVKSFFTSLDYWKLTPHDALVTSSAPRTADRSSRVEASDIHVTNTRAPATTYWCLAEPGKTYVVYVRGSTEPLHLALSAPAASTRWRAEQFNPRTGARQPLTAPASAALATSSGQPFLYHPPDAQDWLLVVRAAK